MKIGLIHGFKEIISVDNLLCAWKDFLKGKRGKKDVCDFSARLMDNILSLHADLANKTYVHGSYHAFKVNDPKPRDIHKATVRDRVLHRAIYRILYPYFDKKFIHDSYSCRNGKGTHRAMNRFRDFFRKVSENNTKTCYVLKCDVRKFFASIEHNILIDILKKHISDENIVWLLRQVVSSFHSPATFTMNTFRSEDVHSELFLIGLPLGNLTSQLFANVYLNELDQFVKYVLKIKYYIRYADDFVFFSTDKKYLDNLIPIIQQFLTKKLKLELRPDKVFIKTVASGVDFLGWVHFSDHRILRTATRRKMVKKVSRKNVTSYLGMLKHGNMWKREKVIKNRVWYN